MFSCYVYILLWFSSRSFVWADDLTPKLCLLKYSCQVSNHSGEVFLLIPPVWARWYFFHIGIVIHIIESIEFQNFYILLLLRRHVIVWYFGWESIPCPEKKWEINTLPRGRTHTDQYLAPVGAIPCPVEIHTDQYLAPFLVPKNMKIYENLLYSVRRGGPAGLVYQV